MKLTQAQTNQLNQLKEFGPLRVWNSASAILRTFEALEKKGLVTSEKDGLFIKFTLTN